MPTSHLHALQTLSPVYGAVGCNDASLIASSPTALATVASSSSFYSYYFSCYVAGGASSSIRWLMNPLELVKTRMQINPSNKQYSTFVTGLRTILNENGVHGLFQGLGPTAIAYMLQTSIKYGTYEVFKDIVIPGAVSDEYYQTHKGLVYVTAAASAEAIADIFMCPFEMLKVKMQSSANVATAAGSIITANATQSPPSVSKVTFPIKPTTIQGLLHMMKYRDLYQFPFGSLGPLWMRQIPGTIVNFYTFENTSQYLHNTVLPYLHGPEDDMDYNNGMKLVKSDYPMATQVLVTLVSGYTAGFFASIVSHPADTIITLTNQNQYKNLSILKIIEKVGIRNIATKGLGPRMLVTSNIICFQWFLYDTFKTMMGYPGKVSS